MKWPQHWRPTLSSVSLLSALRLLSAVSRGKGVIAVSGLLAQHALTCTAHSLVDCLTQPETLSAQNPATNPATGL